MRIAVIGATGMAGSAIVAEALARGHHVTAISRHPDPDTDHEQLTAHAADVADTGTLDPILTEADAAILTIRLATGKEHRLAPLTRGLLDAAARQGTRVLIVGGAAPLRSPQHPNQLLIDDPNYVPEAWRTIAQASLNQLRTCQEHSYTRWVYLSPPAIFEPGNRTGSYRRGDTTLLTDMNGFSRISAPDLAIAVVDELEHPSNKQHFTIAEDRTS